MQETLEPSQLFSRRIFNYQVNSARRGRGKYVNLDHAATTPPFQSVEVAVHNFLTSYGSVHRGAGVKSLISSAAYDDAREHIKSYVNAQSGSYLIYAQNTTGAINTLSHFFTFLEGKIALSALEHSSSYLPWVMAEGRLQCCRKVHPEPGRLLVGHQAMLELLSLGHCQIVKYQADPALQVDLESLETLLTREKIKALVLTATSNITGISADIAAVSAITRSHGVYLVVDACQYLQHHELDMSKLGIDFLVASGHKFYAPYGGGFVIGPGRFFDNFLPYQIGGGNLDYISNDGTVLWRNGEHLHDPGTPNAVGSIAMEAALREMHRLGLPRIEAYERELSAACYQQLSRVPGVQLFTKKGEGHSIISFSLEGICARDVAATLNRDYGIGVRAGSFCAYEALRRLLKLTPEWERAKLADGNNPSEEMSIVRASIGLSNSWEDIKIFVDAVDEIAREVPSLRPGRIEESTMVNEDRR